MTTVTLTRTTPAAASSKQENDSLSSSAQQLKRKNPLHFSLSSPCSCYNRACQYRSGFTDTPVARRSPQMLGWELGQCPWVPFELEFALQVWLRPFTLNLGSTYPTGKSSRKAALHFRQPHFFLLTVLTPRQLSSPWKSKWKQSCWNQTVLPCPIKLPR